MIDSGIINVNKPSGITSNDVISAIKKKLHPKKIGHLGTLDPEASGVLPVCINKATKLFDYYLKKDKIYRTIFVFGKETDTLDSEGQIAAVDDVNISTEQILNIIPKLIGKVAQLPPKFSAKKVNGKKAYELARKGVEFDLKSKDVEIYNINVVKQISKNTFLLEIHCSSGTYVRSIARDMASMLGTVAYVAAIIRTKSGNFKLETSVELNDISESTIIPLKNILKDWKNIFVKDEFYDKITNGCILNCQENDVDNVVVYCKSQLIGIGNIKNGHLKIITSLWEQND